MSTISLPAPRPLAFGVDPTRRERYSLRQARYHALSEDVAEMLAARPSAVLKLLDVGLCDGVSMRYLEALSGSERIEYHGVDIDLKPTIYRPHRWASLIEDDLLAGLPRVESEQFDVVICEQVLEHLPEVDLAMTALDRVLKPGGALIVGVPIFPPGFDLVRRQVVPRIDKLIQKRKPRSHLQAFTLKSFLAALNRHCEVAIDDVRGFRVVSGGVLRPLENFRWWWRLGRATGRVVPELCTEVQIVGIKSRVERRESRASMKAQD
jgi:2-polyprenyl-3-methyl-5-hydroxy-6-metoxy-1,4-benzoquinol methylase